MICFTKFYLVYWYKSKQSIMTDYNKLTRLAVDTETTGLDPIRDQLLTIQLKHTRSKTGILLEHIPGRATIDPDNRKLLLDQSTVKVIHNASFDIPFIWHHTGIRIRTVFDTRLAEGIILGVGVQRGGLNEKYSASLGATLERRGIAKLNKEITKQFIGHTGKLTKEQIHYALQDVQYLIPLMDEQLQDIEKLDVMELVQLENEVVEIVSKMKMTGIGFNLKRWYEIAKMNQNKYEEILSELPAHINWASPKQIKEFFGRKGILVESLTTIDEQINEHPLIKRLMEMRKYYKYTTTYGMGWLTDKNDRPTIHEDGRIRCNFDQIIQTGRFSCSDPNLQQIPSDGGHRSAFVPAKGYKFVIGDFTGQELGIMAAAAEEESWINAMINDDDIHSVMAKLLYGDRWDRATAKGCNYPKRCECPKHKPLRKNAKDLSFGLAYGKGPMALAIDLGISDEEAMKLIQLFNSKIPNVKRWLERNGRRGELKFEARTLPPFNRYRNLEIEPEGWRRRNQGKNTPVQGTGGDMLKLAMCYINRYIEQHNLDVRIVLCVHDELITECKTDYANGWRKEMKRLMEEAAVYILKYPVVKVTPYVCDQWIKP